MRSAITISHLIRNKANMLTQSPSTVASVGVGGAAGLLIEADSYLFSSNSVFKSELVIA